MAVDLTGWVAVHNLERREQAAVAAALTGLQANGDKKLDGDGKPVAIDMGSDEVEWHVSPALLAQVRSAQPAASTTPVSQVR
jgi:hypothetical protein